MAADRTSGLGIALGGGGMKGLAHVGVLSVLEANDLFPDRVAGTSIGAIIGGLYAAGASPAKIRQLIQDHPLHKLMSLRLDGSSLLDLDPLSAFLKDQMGEVRLEDLPIPFFPVATDLESGQRVVLDGGPAVDAIVASASIPGIFPPVEWESRLLVDGGICDNLPIEPLRERGCKAVVAVRLFHQKESWRLENAVKSAQPDEETGSLWRKGLDMNRLRELPALLAERWFHAENYVPNVFHIAERGLSLMILRLEEARLVEFPADVLIAPNVAFVGTLDFEDRKSDIFDAGTAAAESVVADLVKLRERLADG